MTFRSLKILQDTFSQTLPSWSEKTSPVCYVEIKDWWISVFKSFIPGPRWLNCTPNTFDVKSPDPDCGGLSLWDPSPRIVKHKIFRECKATSDFRLWWRNSVGFRKIMKDFYPQNTLKLKIVHQSIFWWFQVSDRNSWYLWLIPSRLRLFYLFYFVFHRLLYMIFISCNFLKYHSLYEK